jgi:hypothetical protein
VADEYSPVEHLIAQWYEIPVSAAHVIWQEMIAAFKQAMTEFGIAEHPGGRCPAPGCQCSPLEALVTARANELLGFPDGG